MSEDYTGPEYSLEFRRASAKAARIQKAREDAADVSEFVEENGDNLAFVAFFEHDRFSGEGFVDAPGQETLHDMEDTLRRFEDAFAGEWDSENEYTEDAIEQGLFGDLPEGPLSRYIDVQSLTRDVFESDMFSIRTGSRRGIYAFYNN